MVDKKKLPPKEVKEEKTVKLEAVKEELKKEEPKEPKKNTVHLNLNELYSEVKEDVTFPDFVGILVKAGKYKEYLEEVIKARANEELAPLLSLAEFNEAKDKFMFEPIE